MSFTGKTDWADGDILPHGDMNRIEQGIIDAHTDINGKLGKTANAVSATKLKNARNINGKPFDGTEDIIIPMDDSYTVANPELLGTWKENPSFGECLVVKVGRTCTLSGWLIEGEPWSNSTVDVLKLPAECVPTRPIFVSFYTMGATLSGMIDHTDSVLKIFPTGIDKPSSSSDMVGFTVTYVILDRE